MKVSQKIISLILVLTMAVGLATTPSFAAAENTEYENSLKSGWGSSTSNFQYPSAYNTSWNRQVINFIDLVAQRTQNVYNRLGDMSSTLINISTNTGYIQSISQHFNSTLHSGWGDSSTYFMVPSGMRGSWYGASLMLLDTIQQRLAEPLFFELDTTTQAILDNISTNTDNITTNSGIISNNTQSIVDILSYFTARTSQVWYRTSDKYSLRRTGQYGSYNIGGFAIPQRASNSNTSSEAYRWNYQPTNDMTLLKALESMSITNNFMLSKLITPYSSYGESVYDPSTNSVIAFKDDYGYDVNALSIADILDHYFRQFLLGIGKIQYVIADDDTISAKNANKPQEQSVISNFTGSGSASASVNDFTGVKDSVSALKTSLSGGASYTQAFNILSGDSDGWSWFTNEVAESMDTTSNGNTRLRSVSDSTPYLDSYYSELSSYLGFSYNGGIE